MSWLQAIDRLSQRSQENGESWDGSEQWMKGGGREISYVPSFPLRMCVYVVKPSTDACNFSWKNVFRGANRMQPRPSPCLGKSRLDHWPSVECWYVINQSANSQEEFSTPPCGALTINPFCFCASLIDPWPPRIEGCVLRACFRFSHRTSKFVGVTLGNSACKCVFYNSALILRQEKDFNVIHLSGSFINCPSLGNCRLWAI